MFHDGTNGTYFAVWAPNARFVSVIGDFNGWDREAAPLSERTDGSGIWETFFAGSRNGECYKYFIRSSSGYEVEKGDPYALYWETPPQTASIIWDLNFNWTDKKWLKKRKAFNPAQQPLSVYEVHLGSWKRKPEEDNRMLNIWNWQQIFQLIAVEWDLPM